MIVRLLVTIGSILLIGLLVWEGQQRPPDRYLEQIQRNGVLRVGLDPTYPPFDTLTNGQVAGYDADLARVIGRDLGVQVQFSTISLDALYDALAADKVDVLISALPFVYERQKDVRYSIPYYQGGQVLVVTAGNATITSANDLEGKSVGVELGSASDTEARLLARTTVPGMRLDSSFHSPEEALNALIQSRVNAVITDHLSAQEWQQAHPGTITILPKPITDEPYVIAMPARADALAASINGTITRLSTSGELGRMMGSSR